MSIEKESSDLLVALIRSWRLVFVEAEKSMLETGVSINNRGQVVRSPGVLAMEMASKRLEKLLDLAAALGAGGDVGDDILLELGAAPGVYTPAPKSKPKSKSKSKAKR